MWSEKEEEMISSVKFLLSDFQGNGSLEGKRYWMKDCAFGDGADVGDDSYPCGLFDRVVTIGAFCWGEGRGGGERLWF